MNFKLIKNILIYGIGDFVVTGVTAFLFIPLYLNFLTTEEYGIFNILNNNTTLFVYIFQLGIISAYSRIYFIKKKENTEKKYTWNVMCFHLLYSIFLISIYLLFKKIIINSLAPSINGSNLVYYSPIMAYLTFIPALYYIYLRIEEKANKFVLYQILTVALISIIILLSYLFYKINLISILISFLLGNTIIWLIILFNIKFTFSFKLKIKDITETLSFAFPIFISYIAYFFISKYSIIILQNHINLDEIGKFSLAQQIASIPSLITIAISKAVQPKLFSSNSEIELKLKAQKLDNNFKLIMIWIVGSLIFSVDIIFSYFLPSSFNSIVTATKYLLLINLIYNFAIVENTILLYKLKSQIILIITICGSILNVLLSNILIKSHLLNGVIISMGIAFSVNLILSIYYSRKYIKLNYQLKTIILFLIYILVYIIITSKKSFHTIENLNVFISIISFIILTISILIILKKRNNDFIN